MDRLISEQAVIDSIEFFQMNPQHFDFVNLIDDIKEIPSAEPQTGHWIEEINDYGEVTGWHCDKCYEDSGFTTDCKWNYCPNCGVRMVEPQESEEV
jgi:hypothetical protein